MGCDPDFLLPLFQAPPWIQTIIGIFLDEFWFLEETNREFSVNDSYLRRADCV